MLVSSYNWQLLCIKLDASVFKLLRRTVSMNSRLLRARTDEPTHHFLNYRETVRRGKSALVERFKS